MTASESPAELPAADFHLRVAGGTPRCRFLLSSRRRNFPPPIFTGKSLAELSADGFQRSGADGNFRRGRVESDLLRNFPPSTFLPKMPMEFSARGGGARNRCEGFLRAPADSKAERGAKIGISAARKSSRGSFSPIYLLPPFAGPFNPPQHADSLQREKRRRRCQKRRPSGS